MKTIIQSTTILLFIFLVTTTTGQISEDSLKIYQDTIRDYRKGKNIKLMYSESTPLTPEQHKNFKGLKYFDPDITYQVKAALVKADLPDTVIMRTSTERAPEYIEYGIVKFILGGTEYELKVYQSKKLLDVKPGDRTLFIPFRDATSGKETYGGGRYVDCIIPGDGHQMILDFNKAYNPYCAYNPRYSCVIPPEENRLPIAIKAGEKIFEEH
ncbi:MAG: DUF1684 domain-containing protein [Bacteroidetes bacterium]|nr:DUF1684 domain-containing protein [Bacteroidota bacterium]